jgi:hypothetical protein
MEISTNLSFYLPSSNSDDIADINQISDNFRNLDEYIPGMFREVKNDIRGKQDVLVSGENIKSINGESLLGEGNLELAVEVDQTFDAESQNAQSGIAVAEAVSGKADIPNNYELIEAITLTEEVDEVYRNLEPDGTPYNFTNMLVMCTCPPTDKTIETYFSFHRMGTWDGGYITISANSTTKGTGWGTCDIVGGTAFYRNCSNGTSVYNSRTHSSTIPRVNFGNIKLLQLRKGNANLFPIGTTFEIWGVRA